MLDGKRDPGAGKDVAGCAFGTIRVVGKHLVEVNVEDGRFEKALEIYTALTGYLRNRGLGAFEGHGVVIRKSVDLFGELFDIAGHKLIVPGPAGAVKA